MTTEYTTYATFHHFLSDKKYLETNCLTMLNSLNTHKTVTLGLNTQVNILSHYLSISLDAAAAAAQS